MAAQECQQVRSLKLSSRQGPGQITHGQADLLSGQKPVQKPHLFEFRKQNRAPTCRRRGISGAFMTITSFASFDAYDPCAEIGADDMVFWLQPRSTAQVQRSENGPSRYLFLRLTASLSLSAFMTFGSISAAIAPAAAHTLVVRPDDPQ